jgi:hypothetical protein
MKSGVLGLNLAENAVFISPGKFSCSRSPPPRLPEVWTPRFLPAAALRFSSHFSSSNHPSTGRREWAVLSGTNMTDVLVGKLLHKGKIAPQAAFCQRIKRFGYRDYRHGLFLTNCGRRHFVKQSMQFTEDAGPRRPENRRADHKNLRPL